MGKVGVWAVAVVGGLAAVGLTLVAILTDQDTTNRVIAVSGAITGVATVVVAAAALARTPPPAPAPAPSTGGGSVEAGKNAVVAGGSIIGSALGDRSQVSGPATAPVAGPPPAGSGDVRVGDGGVVAGGDIIDSALGDDSRREP
ncbi:hypothetical protein [Streptomyces mayteni]